jgi:hypothetical protein
MCFQFSPPRRSFQTIYLVIITTAMFIAVFTESVLTYIESKLYGNYQTYLTLYCYNVPWICQNSIYVVL